MFNKKCFYFNDVPLRKVFVDFFSFYGILISRKLYSITHGEEMQRYLQFTIVEPLEPASTPDMRIQVEAAIIGIDLYTGHVTLPGRFVCSLDSLTQVVNEMGKRQMEWAQSGCGPRRLT